MQRRHRSTIQAMELLYLRKVEGGARLDRAPNKDIIIIRRLKVETELAVADRKGVEAEEGRNAIGEVGEKN